MHSFGDIIACRSSADDHVGLRVSVGLLLPSQYVLVLLWCLITTALHAGEVAAGD